MATNYRRSHPLDWTCTSRPCVDHGLLSPSGRISKRARTQAVAREARLLFPPDYFDVPRPPADRKAQLLAHAARLDELADRGMSRRRYRRLAAAARTEAESLK